MTDKCGSCGKTVSPLERINGAGKAWHKACFRCMSENPKCNITLDLKTVNASAGKIYCKAHVPKHQAKQVADTVAMKTALNAPKKVSESTGNAQKGDQNKLTKPTPAPGSISPSQPVTPASLPVPAASTGSPTAREAELQAIIDALRREKALQPQVFVPNIAPDAVTTGEQIGSGAYKVVYRALWNGAAAAKLTLKATASDAKAVSAFEAELKTLSALRHPNIVQLWGRITGELALVMELCERGSLYTVLSRTTASTAAGSAAAGSGSGDAKSPAGAAAAAKGSGAKAVGGGVALDDARKWRYARDAIRAVAYLHGLKPPLIHRDIKPHNFLVTSDDTLKLTDFGFAAVQAHSTGLTASSGRGGTFAYQSPEQFEDDEPAGAADAADAGGDGGAGRSKVTTKADVYALGGVLLELFGGAAPWTGASAKGIYQSVTLKGKTPPELAAFPAGDIKSQSLEPCFAADPKARPTALELLHALERLGTTHFVAVATAPAAAPDPNAKSAALEWRQKMLSGLAAAEAAADSAAAVAAAERGVLLDLLTKLSAAAAANGWDIN